MHYLHDAREELKRVDHLLYVSLKYTRTVDVLKSVIDRIVTCLEEVINSLLEKAEEEHKILEAPSNAALRAEEVKKVYDDPIIHEMIDFFFYLRRLRRADYKKSSEYRRHVTMSVIFDKTILSIDIDKMKEFYDATVKFVEHAETVVHGKKDEL